MFKARGLLGIFRFFACLVLVVLIVVITGVVVVHHAVSRSFGEDFINDTEFHRLRGVEKGVAVHDPFNGLNGLTSVVHVELVQIRSGPKDLACLNVNVTRHPMGTTTGLMQHDASVRTVERERDGERLLANEKKKTGLHQKDCT